MGYISTDDYIALIGKAETVRVTDESKTGNVNTDKLQKTIDDQAAVIDAYLSTRYTLPIVGTYPPLAGINAALAREALNPTTPSQTITDNADRARAQLRDLSAGRAELPGENGLPGPALNPTGSATSTGDARPRVFTDDSLADFTSFYPGYGGTVFGGPMGW